MDLGPLGSGTAESFPTLCVSISLAPRCYCCNSGRACDYSNLKKRLMALFVMSQSLPMRCVLHQREPVFVGGLLFDYRQCLLGAALVF